MTQTTGAENSTQQSNPFLFRSPQSDPVSQSARVQQSDIATDTPVSVEPTVTEYPSINKVPYTAKFFGLDSSFNDLSGKDRKSIEKIDSYLISKIKSGEYPDSVQSGESMIKDIMSRIKLTDGHDPYFKIDKISEYMQVISDPLNLRRDQDREKRSLKINLTKETRTRSELANKLDRKLRSEQTLRQQVAVQKSKNATLKLAFKKLLEAI